MTKEPTVTVVASINMDLVVSADRRPAVGETIHTKDFKTLPGGKGANQNVTAARLGAKVHMFGRVGHDEFGHSLNENLKKEGIFRQDVEPVTDCPSGVAVITLAEQDNSLMWLSPMHSLRANL